ncbi:MAG: hypothetical protein JWM55_20 [Acidimicrobiaceae bacterium]|nr:hypothetical protein [Acidimicrobiaceae bacterium]
MDELRARAANYVSYYNHQRRCTQAGGVSPLDTSYRWLATSSEVEKTGEIGTFAHLAGREAVKESPPANIKTRRDQCTFGVTPR